MFAARLRAYEPNSGHLGYLPDPLSWDISVVHGDVGALTVQYSSLAAGGEYLQRSMDEQGLEVALELWDDQTDTWVEPRGCRLVRLGQGDDLADDMEVFSVTFRSWGWLLTKALLTMGVASDGRRVFTGETADSLLDTLLSESDSYGGPPVTLIEEPGVWPVLPDQVFEYGTDYLAIVRGLQEAGALDWATQARGLYIYQADSANLSPDLSESIVLRLGHEIGAAPSDESIEQMISGVAVRASAGGTVIVEEPTAPTPWGKWRRLLSIGQVDDQTAAEAVGQAELDRTSRVRQQYTRELILHEGAPRPLLDYWPGAWITAPTSVPGEAVRVQQVTLTWGQDGFGGNLVLNDRFLDADIRQRRKLGAALPGQVGSGGAPAPIAVDPEADRIPSVPANLGLSAAVEFIGSIPRGVVTADWDVVTTGTDAGPMVIAGYEMQWRIGSGDWQAIFTGEISAEVRDLTPGDSVDVRVRAVGARTTLPSAWSATENIVVPGDVTPPSVPSLPVVDSRLGIVRVTWDGLSDTAQPMEEDFARVEVAMEDSATPTTVVGFLTRASTLPVTGQTYGDEVQVRLRSVDTSGNASAWSAVSDPVLVQAVEGPDLAANSVTTNALVAGSVTGEILAGEILLGSTITTAEDGQRVEISQDGIRLYDEDEVIRVDLPTAPGEKARFRGQVEADGLVVREGTTFYSPLNEFAQDSVVNLAEKVTAPAEPNIYPVWERTTLTLVTHNGSLGNFALDCNEAIGVGRDFRSSEERVLIFQSKAAGTRIWTYELDGSYVGFEDWSGYTITGGIYTDSLAGWFGRQHSNGNWYFRHTNGVLRQYAEVQTSNVVLGWNGTDVLLCDEVGSNYRFRRVDVSTNPISVLESVTSATSVTPSGEKCFIYKGNADFGSTRWIVGHINGGVYRVHNSSGVGTAAADDWHTPGQRVGGFWDGADGRFYTVTSAGYLWRHSDLNWSDPALDPIHLGQAFVDTNATGGTHTTDLGLVLTAPKRPKRAITRVDMQEVSFSGDDDDPNGWQLWGKRGSAPLGDLSDMKLQASGDYTTSSFDMDFFPLTAGGGAPTVNTFPEANPARLKSQRTLSVDPTIPLFQVKGDGQGGWGPFAVRGDGQDDWAWRGNASQWNQFSPLATGWTHVSGEEFRYTWRFGIMYIQGRVTAGATAGQNVVTIPQASLWPDNTIRGIVGWEFGGDAIRAQIFGSSGVLQLAAAPTSGRTYAFNFNYPYKFFQAW